MVTQAASNLQPHRVFTSNTGYRLPKARITMTGAGLGDKSKLDEQGYDTPGSSADSYHTGEDFSEPGTTALLSLPPEILDQILTQLEPQSLLTLERTCRKLSYHATKDTLWAAYIRQHVPPGDFPETPSPAPTYRSLYLAHHPYWFLPQHALWFSDDAYTGAIMVVRFDPRRGCIEGYRLLGEKGAQWIQPWSHIHDVSIHSFKPRIKLWLDHPLLKLPYNPDLSLRSQGTFPWDGEIRMSRGILSPAGHSTSVSASFFLSRDIEARWQDPKMQLWPPTIIPDVPRARSSQGDSGKFRGAAHKPQKYDQISQTSFRTRVWTQFHIDTARYGVRLGEEVATWSTLPRHIYTPTPDKPYQGIWVGDYAGHGCEFLLLIQTPTAPPLPARREPFNDLFGPILGRDLDDESDDEFDETLNGIADPSSPSSIASVFGFSPAGPSTAPTEPPNSNSSPSNSRAEAHAPEPGHSGALQAIKLTGDINVPRGQHTFIADDLGPSGYIRHATERPFEGARIVKSRGHVAGRGFVEGEFQVVFFLD